MTSQLPTQQTMMRGQQSNLHHWAWGNERVKTQSCFPTHKVVITASYYDVCPKYQPYVLEGFLNHQRNTNSETEEHSQEYLRAKATVEYFFESIPFVALMSIMTIWALYNDDIRQAFTDKVRSIFYCHHF